MILYNLLGQATVHSSLYSTKCDEFLLLKIDVDTCAIVPHDRLYEKDEIYS